MANLARKIKPNVKRFGTQTQSASVTLVTAGAVAGGVARATLSKPDGSFKFGDSRIDVEPVAGIGLMFISTLIPKARPSKVTYDLAAGVMVGYLGRLSFRTLKKR